MDQHHPNEAVKEGKALCCFEISDGNEKETHKTNSSDQKTLTEALKSNIGSMEEEPLLEPLSLPKEHCIQIPLDQIEGRGKLSPPLMPGTKL